MYTIYKTKNKLFLLFLVSFISLSYYMYTIENKIEKEFQTHIEHAIITQYEIYKKNKSKESFSVKNREFIDTTEMINEYKQITPLMTSKQKESINKHDITFDFITKSENTKINKYLSYLKDEEYLIQYNNKNQVILFGKVFDTGYVKITQNISHLHAISSELDTLRISFFIIACINIVLFLYLLLLIKNMKQSAINLNNKFEEMQKDTQLLAFKDKLTGAATRLKFDVVLKELVDVSTRFEEHKFSIIMIDIDNFKSVNDTYGHDYGDVVLKNVAEVILNNKRKSDTFARWGGEEFVIIVPLSTIEETYIFADKIRKCISKISFEKLDQITCSFGVTQFKKGDDETTMMKRADEFLYLAKKNGKNRVEY